MSSIGWVDFSSEHREKVKSVIDRLSIPGVIDELGIGVIRDSFSDSLFPGISTIQTRAKYFLTIPRIFRDYQKRSPKKRRRKPLSVYLNEEENRCMKAMVANHEDDPQDGIIGESFAKKSGEVQRKPSSVYWTGLREFGLVQTRHSLQAFCRRFANPDQPLQDLVRGSKKEKGDDPEAGGATGTKINGPSYDDDWVESLTVQLSAAEASFLSNQIQSRVPMSLMGQILLAPAVRKEFLDLPSDWNFTTLADEASFMTNLPDELQRTVIAARDFWQLMAGAHIRYNCLLQRKHGTKTREEEFESEFDHWLSQLQSFSWERWDTDSLWKLTQLHKRKVKTYTIDFVVDWIDAVADQASKTELDVLVTHQERLNKKGRARLHPAADEKIDKWVGIDDLNYRLNVARTIINDIDVGLSSEAGDA